MKPSMTTLSTFGIALALVLPHASFGQSTHDCSSCSSLTSAQEEALATYEGTKKIVCDPTCLDGVSNPIHCNYFGLGQICRGCGDCPSCTPCPGDTTTPTPTTTPMPVTIEPTVGDLSTVPPTAPPSIEGGEVAVTCIDEILTATLPDVPKSFQFGLLVDMSSSYSNDLLTLRGLAPDLVDGLLYAADGTERDLRLALGTYIDIPEGVFGSSSDYAYREETNFDTCDAEDVACKEASRTAWFDALNDLSTGNGGDVPESQSIGLMSAINEWDWAEGYTKFLAITTDAPFHTPKDDERYFAVDAIIAAANAKGIKIIALKAGDADDEMDQLAAGTGTEPQTTTTDSSDIINAILQGVATATYDEVEVAVDCEEPWTLESGAAETDVSAGTSVDFDITVCASSNTSSTCTISVVADSAVVEDFTYAVLGGSPTLTA